MAEEKGVALAVLGVVAVLAIVGLVLLFTGAKTGQSVYYPYDYEGGKFVEATYRGATAYAPADQYGPDSMTGGPYQVRGRLAQGYEVGGPRYNIEAGGESVGVYGQAMNTGGGYPR